MRTIDHIIVHCTATPSGRATTVAEIDSWHRARDWRDPVSGKSIGYHYVVHLDGKVSEGRPVSSVGAHVAGKNTGSIGVVYVGGVDRLGKPQDTRTGAQKAALELLIKDLIKRFPIKDISGHNEWAAKACPSFDASKEYDHLIVSTVPHEQRKEMVMADELIVEGEEDNSDETTIADWQRSLRSYGYDIEPNGKHTGLSVKATRWFQKAEGIVVDGIVGPQAFKAMEVFLSGKKKELEPIPDDIPVPTPVTKPKQSPMPELTSGGGGAAVTGEGIRTGNWWLIGIGAAIVIAVIVIYFVRRK